MRQLTLSRTIRQMEKDLAHQEAVTQTMLSHRNMASYHAREKVVAKLSAELTEIRDRARLHQTQLKFNFLPVQNTGDPDKQLLLASGLEIRFQERVLFSGVSFEIRGRDKICVCGPNGCGKSTLLALLLGKIPHSNGALRLSEKQSLAIWASTSNFSMNKPVSWTSCWPVLLSTKQELAICWLATDSAMSTFSSQFPSCPVASGPTLPVLPAFGAARPPAFRRADQSS